MKEVHWYSLNAIEKYNYFFFGLMMFSVAAFLITDEIHWALVLIWIGFSWVGCSLFEIIKYMRRNEWKKKVIRYEKV